MVLLTLQLRSTEVLDNILPVRGIIMATQVRLQLAAENLQRSTLADTVGSHKTEHLTRSGHGQTMKLEAVGAITMGDLVLEIGGQVDDGDGVEGALLGADTATDTETLRDERETRLGSNFNTELATANYRAGLFTLLTTLARTTLRRGDLSVWRGTRGEDAKNSTGTQRTLSLLTMAIL